MTITLWCDNNANSQSKKTWTVDLADFGVTDEEWAEMTEDEKEELLKDEVWQTFDWGWEDA